MLSPPLPTHAQQLFWWNVRRGLKSLPTPGGSIPIFGHALLLMKKAPWDMMHQWVKEAGGGLLRIDFLMKVGGGSLAMPEDFRGIEPPQLLVVWCWRCWRGRRHK